MPVLFLGIREMEPKTKVGTKTDNVTEAEAYVTPAHTNLSL